MENYQKIASETKEDLNKGKKNKRFEYVVCRSVISEHIAIVVDNEPYLDLKFFCTDA